MRDRVFLDTNIFIYLYSETETEKRDTAYRVFDTYHCITSLQVMNEASNVWLRKYGWSRAKICRHLDNIELLCDEILSIGRDTINTALALQELYGYSYYDCLMLAFALASDSSSILTEDMRDGQVINRSLKVINPFVV